MGEVISINDIKKIRTLNSVCIFCGKSKGAFQDDFKEHAKIEGGVIVDYEPCGECKEKFDRGAPIIEVTEYPLFKHQPPIVEDLDGRAVYPTGRYIVLKPEAFGEGYVKRKIILCLGEEFEQIISAIMKNM